MICHDAVTYVLLFLFFFGQVVEKEGRHPPRGYTQVPTRWKRRKTNALSHVPLPEEHDVLVLLLNHKPENNISVSQTIRISLRKTIKLTNQTYLQPESILAQHETIVTRESIALARVEHVKLELNLSLCWSSSFLSANQL